MPVKANIEDDVITIAMWSGPRNISTALMRSFENRPDTCVWDEPFYASYLFHSGLEHPMRSEILSSGLTDWRDVISRISVPCSFDHSIFYQKHMTHHMLSDFDRNWIKSVRNGFLIRDPILVALSYDRRREDPRFEDLGFIEQSEIFDMVCDHVGSCPPIIDSTDLASNPSYFLEKLCLSLDIDFNDDLLSSMLHWPLGRRESDGIWGEHWYGSVWASDGFTAPSSPIPCLSDIPRSLRFIIDRALPYYERLYSFRLK